MKKVRLLSLALALVMLFAFTACDKDSQDGDKDSKGSGFAARSIAFHSEYKSYRYYEEAAPYLQTYFKSIETACHQVLEEGADTFVVSEAGQVAQKKLEALQKAGDLATKNDNGAARLEYSKMFLPYLKVRTQELTANMAISLGNPPANSCEALLKVLNEAHALYAEGP